MQFAIRSFAVALASGLALTTSFVQAQNGAPIPRRGVVLDIGQFAPQARGIIIRLGQDPIDGGRVTVDVPQGGVHLDMKQGTPGNLGGFKLLTPEKNVVFGNVDGQLVIPDFIQIPGLTPGAGAGAIPPAAANPGVDVDLGEAQATPGGDVDLGAPQDLPGSEPAPQPQLGQPEAAPPETVIPQRPQPAEEGPPPQERPESFFVPDAPPPATRAYVGVVAEPLPESLAAQFSEMLNGGGLIVTKITPNSPAERAGLKLHDILVSFDGVALTSMEQFRELTLSGKPGQHIKLLTIRAATQRELDVTLGVKP